MRTAIIMSAALVLALFASGRPAAAHDDERGEHIEKYHKHMNEAYEEFREGDIHDAYKEIGKAQREYNEVIWFAPCYPVYSPPVYYGRPYVVYPRPNWHRTYNYRFGYGW